MPFAAWTPADHCVGAATPGARALMRWILDTYPRASSAGIYNCRSVAGTSSKSAHAEGRALDVHFPGHADPAGTKLVQRLRPQAARLGIQALIWNRTIWSAKSPAAAGRPYLGAHPHYDHVHIELTRRAGERLTLATIRHVLDARGSAKPAASRWQARVDAKPGTRVIARWSVGDDVALLQRYLAVVPANGRYGLSTVAAVKSYQRMRGLRADGIAGPKTWAPIITDLDLR